MQVRSIMLLSLNRGFSLHIKLHPGRLRNPQHVIKIFMILKCENLSWIKVIEFWSEILV